jgi:transposase-like protein
MTDSDSGEQHGLACGILKRDARGRVRTTAEQRAAILGEFERSGLSGPQFARVAGINYQTFATWRQQQQKSRTGSRLRLPDKAPAALLPRTDDNSFHFAEVVVQAATADLRSTGATMLRVHLRDGVHLEIRDAGEVALAVQLIKALQTVC